jgi:hypothetical protein
MNGNERVLAVHELDEMLERCASPMIYPNETLQVQHALPNKEKPAGESERERLAEGKFP